MKTLLDDKKAESLFCVGGSYLYDHITTSPHCKTLHVTTLFNHFNCDRFFSPYEDSFSLSSESEVKQFKDVSYQFKTFSRKI